MLDKLSLYYQAVTKTFFLDTSPYVLLQPIKVWSVITFLILTLSPPTHRLPSNHPSLSVGGKAPPRYTYPALSSPPVSVHSSYL